MYILIGQAIFGELDDVWPVTIYTNRVEAELHLTELNKRIKFITEWICDKCQNTQNSHVVNWNHKLQSEDMQRDDYIDYVNRDYFLDCNASYPKNILDPESEGSYDLANVCYYIKEIDCFETFENFKKYVNFKNLFDRMIK